MGKNTVQDYDNWDLWDKLTFYKKKISLSMCIEHTH